MTIFWCSGEGWEYVVHDVKETQNLLAEGQGENKLRKS